MGVINIKVKKDNKIIRISRTNDCTVLKRKGYKVETFEKNKIGNNCFCKLIRYVK